MPILTTKFLIERGGVDETFMRSPDPMGLQAIVAVMYELSSIRETGWSADVERWLWSAIHDPAAPGWPDLSDREVRLSTELRQVVLAAHRWAEGWVTHTDRHDPARAFIQNLYPTLPADYCAPVYLRTHEWIAAMGMRDY